MPASRRIHALALVIAALVLGAAACACAQSADSSAVPVPDTALVERMRASGADRAAEPVPADAGARGAPVPAAAPTDTASRRPRWALVLSGGAARGLGEIGVLRALEAEGVRPDLVVGSSMGAVVGAFYASGLDADAIAAHVRRVGWDAVFDPRAALTEWRGASMPAPWILMVHHGRGLRLPASLFDESSLDQSMAQELAGADALAQGDFDRLRIPLRVVATDLATLSPVVLRRGSVARAVRASTSVPLLFPPVPVAGGLLIDGGTASNLPVGTARAEGVDHILAVDVAVPQPTLDRNSSALTLALTLMDRVNKRGQTDTLAAGDRLVWLRMPGISATDFVRLDSMIAVGERVARPAVRAAAAAWGLERVAPPAPPVDTLPPLRDLPRWIDERGAPARRSAAADALFGRLPAGPMPLATLEDRFRRVYRGGLFVSAWPAFRAAGDSTAVTVEVRDHEPAQVTFAFAYDTDELGRANAALAMRPLGGSWPGFMVVGATVRRNSGQLYLSAEPHALYRGGPGWFVRGGLRRTDTRRFEGPRVSGLMRSDRVEAMLGRQVPLPTGDVAQVGAGLGRVRTAAGTQSGAIGALRSESVGPFTRRLDGVVLAGPDGYAAVEARLGYDLSIGPIRVEPALAGAWASRRAPPDEQHGVGGPDSFSGLRRLEWLGDRVTWCELRLARGLSSALEVHVVGQAARVREAASRADLGDDVRFAGGVGGRLNVPFGPLRVDWGATEGGERRLEIALGQTF